MIFLRKYDIIGVILESNLYLEKNRILSLSKDFKFNNYPNKNLIQIFKFDKKLITGLLFDEFLAYYTFNIFSNTKEIYLELAVNLYLSDKLISWMKQNNISSDYYYEKTEDYDELENDDNFIELYNSLNDIEVLEIFKFPDLPVVRLNVNNEITYLTISDKLGDYYYDLNGDVFIYLMSIENKTILSMLENYYIGV